MPQIKTQISSGSSPSNAAVPQSRAINTTAPLQGGGTLNNDLTLSIDTTLLGTAFVGQSNVFTQPNFFTAPTYGGASAVGGARYLTSGELQTGAGTGDAIKNADNWWTGSKNVFGPTTAVTISGVLTSVGSIQISGAQNISYAPIYNNAFGIAGSRYVTSGELAGIGSASGDAIRGADNFWTGSQNVFSANTNVTVSGFLRGGTSTRYLLANKTGGVQISGGALEIHGDTATAACPFIVRSSVYSARLDTGSGKFVAPRGFSTQQVMAFTSVDDISGTSDGVVLIRRQVGANTRFLSCEIYSALGSMSPFQASQLVAGPGTSAISNATGIDGWKLFIMASGTVGGAIKALGTVVTSGNVFHYGGAAYNGDSVVGSLRYVTSGELTVGVPGSGDAIRNSDNFFTGSQDVFGPTTNVVVSGALQVLGAFGNVAGRSMVVTGSGYYQGRSQFDKLLDNDRVSFDIPTRFNSPHSVSVFGDIQASGALLAYSDVTATNILDFTGASRINLATGNTLIAGAAYANASATSANRYVTSGEIRSSTGVLAADSVYWTGPAHVFGPSTAVTISGIARFGTVGGTAISAAGDIQASGTITAYGTATVTDIADFTGLSRFNISTTNTLLNGTAYADAIATATHRYVTSGELRGVSIRTLDRQTAPTGIDGTAAYTQAYTQALGGGLLGSTKSFKLSAIGSVGNAGGSPSGFGLRVLYGGTVVFSGGLDAATNTIAAGATKPWRIDTDVQAAGATNKQAASTQSIFGGAGTTTISGEAIGASTSFAANHLMMAVDSTASQNVELWVQNGSTSVTSQVTWVRLELQQ